MRTLATEFDLEIMYVCVCSTNLHITPILFIRIVKIIHVFTLIGRNSGGLWKGAGGQFSFDLPRLLGAGDIASTPPLAQHRMSHSPQLSSLGPKLHFWAFSAEERTPSLSLRLTLLWEWEWQCGAVAFHSGLSAGTMSP